MERIIIRISCGGNSGRGAEHKRHMSLSGFRSGKTPVTGRRFSFLCLLFIPVPGHKKTAVVNGGLLFQSEYALGVLTLHFTVDKQHNDCANHRHNKAAEVKTVNLAKAE